MTSSLKTLHHIVVGVWFIFLGFSLYNVFLPLLIQHVIENRVMVLRPGETFFQKWANPTAPMQTQIYLFELQNAKDFLLGKKPRLVEHGPFVFNQYKKRFNITFLENDSKVQYYETCLFYFDREKSVAGLNDYKITVINLPLIVTLTTVWKNTQSGLMNVLSPVVTSFIKKILSDNNEYITERRTPEQLLIGREAQFIDRLEKYLNLARSMGIQMKTVSSEEMHQTGYFEFRNNTVIGPNIAYTGVRPFSQLVNDFILHNRENWLVQFYARFFGFTLTDTDDDMDQLDQNDWDKLAQRSNRKFLQLILYEGKKYYGKAHWPNCNEIRGTDGMANNDYFVREQRDLTISTAICRPMKLIYQGDVQYNLVNYGHRYIIDPNSFESNRKNWCFCPGLKVSRQRSANDRQVCTNNRSNSRVTCRLISPKNQSVTYKIIGDLHKCDGYHDMSICNEFLPLYISFPHFLQATKYQNAIEGLQPDFDQHGSTFEIEPHFGVTMKAKVSFQLNIKVHPAASVESLNRFKTTLMPYLWFTEHGQIGAQSKQSLFICIAVFKFLYSICIIILLVGVYLLVMLLFGSRNKVNNTKNDNFFDLSQFKKRFSVNWLDKKATNSVFNIREMFKSKMKNSKNSIKRKLNSANSSNRIVPSTPSLKSYKSDDSLLNTNTTVHSLTNYRPVTYSTKTQNHKVQASVDNGLTPLG